MVCSSLRWQKMAAKRQQNYKINKDDHHSFPPQQCPLGPDLHTGILPGSYRSTQRTLPTSLSAQGPRIAHLEEPQIPRIHLWAICKPSTAGAGVEYPVSSFCLQE